jgi:hypothetical protein
MIACANKECGYKRAIVSAEDAAEEALAMTAAARAAGDAPAMPAPP